MTRFAGQPRAGGVRSTMVTVKLQFVLLPCPSLTEQFTVVVPKGNKLPEGGTQLNAGLTVQSSEPVAKYVTRVVKPMHSAVMLLEHLLLLSMLQHTSGTWNWGRYVVVYPAGNSDFAEACTRYRALLVGPSTFSSVTIEELLDAGALPKTTVAAFRKRYIPG